jgi:hypothetical protein
MEVVPFSIFGYFVFGHDAPRQVRCGKWPWPVTAGQGCAYRTPVRWKNQ